MHSIQTARNLKLLYGDKKLFSNLAFEFQDTRFTKRNPHFQKSINISWNQIKLGGQTKLTMEILIGMFLDMVTIGHSGHSNDAYQCLAMFNGIQQCTLTHRNTSGH